MSIILYYLKDDVIKNTLREDSIDLLYYQKAIVPTMEQMEEALKSKNVDSKTYKILENYVKKANGKYDKVVNKIKKELSTVDYKIPLYDEYTKNLYIISRDLVYDKVVHEYFRFPDRTMITMFQNKMKSLEADGQVNKNAMKKLSKREAASIMNEEEALDIDFKYNIHYYKENKQREYDKLVLMTNFLDQFNIDILTTTYIRTFYYYSNHVGKNITVCVRPSFLPHFRHITPYYTKTELIKLGLNMGILKSDKALPDTVEFITSLCDQVKKNDVSAEIIMNHQNYIIKQEKLGIVQYYSLQGSYFMNQYLRGNVKYDHRNEFLETQITSMWELINNAPSFDKEYSVYRFIKSDEHLQHLQVGDEYTVLSFESTTRNPFYSNINHFGFILIKILLPAKTKGAALCMETVSNFPEEQEIILSPFTIYKLLKKDENVMYYHTDTNAQIRIKTKYEFAYAGKKSIQFKFRPELPRTSIHKIVQFRELPIVELLTLTEKIQYFVNNHSNEMYQCKVMIGKTIYTMLLEYYDSVGVYKNFYAVSTNNGFLMYTIIEDHIGFAIELAEQDGKAYMYVNYYFRYSSVPKRGKIKDIDLIDFLVTVAYYFGIQKAIIYCEHESCENLTSKSSERINIYHRGNYCTDFYLYLKSGKKKFDKLTNISVEMVPKFKYSDLDLLKTISPDKVLAWGDRDELYQIYNMTYKHFFSADKYNLSDFYIWLVENYCMHVILLVSKLGIIFNDNNPFNNDYYVFDVEMYMYNNNMKGAEEPGGQVDNLIIPKNKYRIDYSNYYNLSRPSSSCNATNISTETCN
jgi:hypothetical protein